MKNSEQELSRTHHVLDPDDSIIAATVGPPGKDARRRGFEAGPMVRYGVILVVLAVIWEASTRLLAVNPLLFPSFSSVVGSFFRGTTGIGSDTGAFLWPATRSTLWVILRAYGISIVLAVVFSGLALGNRWGRDFLTTLTAIFQPLPSIALLPLALLWFGLNEKSLLFVTVIAMVWPITASLAAGFAMLPNTLRDVGDNYELNLTSRLFRIYLPFALPSALAGLRIGWAYGWRTVVAAELVFGTTGNSGGLGSYIQTARTYLDVSGALSAIVMVILIGVLAESVFRAIQGRTTHKWGLEAA